MTESAADGTASQRRSLFTAWRQAKVKAGVSADSLPSLDDIDRLSQMGLDARLPLDNRAALERYRRELQRLLPGAGQKSPSVARPGAAVPEPVSVAAPAETGGRPGQPSPWAADESAPTTGVPTARPDPGSFAPHNADADDARPDPPGLTGVVVAADGGLRYEWTPGPAQPGAGVRLYRVLVRDDRMPFSPDDRDSLIAVTTEPMVLDQRPVTAAIRYVRVWVNAGPDETRARAAQPVTVAADCVVPPPQNVDISQDGDQVAGEWQVLPGVREVEVYRLPAALASALPDPEFQVGRGRLNLGGFVDDDCPSGTYQYRFYALADSPTDGVTGFRSPPVIRDLAVSAPLAPVSDLRVSVCRDRPNTVNLEWTAPLTGDVQIYRTYRAPNPGAGDTEMPAEAVSRDGRLPADQRLRREVDKSGPIHRLTRVPELAASDQPGGRVFFTPVTVHQERAWIGTPVTHYRLGEISNPRLMQRVDWQLISFGWPAGASTVHAHVTPPGQPLRQPLEGPVAWLDEEEYRLQGGLALGGVLPPQPCDVHLTPILNGPTAVAGRTVVISYHGLIRVWYRMTRRRGLRRERPIELKSDSDVRSSLTFVAIHRPDRLPLSIRDGDQIAQWSSALIRDEWLPLGEVAPRGPGYVRIFVNQPDVPVAIAMIDPSVNVLTW